MAKRCANLLQILKLVAVLFLKLGEPVLTIGFPLKHDQYIAIRCDIGSCVEESTAEVQATLYAKALFFSELQTKNGIILSYPSPETPVNIDGTLKVGGGFAVAAPVRQEHLTTTPYRPS